MSKTANHTAQQRAGQHIAHGKPIALRLTEEEREEAFNRAGAEGRTAANFARQMYLLGLRHYQQQQAAKAPAVQP